MTLSEQVSAFLKERLPDAFSHAAEVTATDLSVRMLENTEQGRGFGPDRYDNTYTPRYARRAKAGKVSPVDLRGKNKSITAVQVSKLLQGQRQKEQSARISFPKAGDVLSYHNEGINYRRVGLKMRSITPKTAQSVPDEVVETAADAIVEVLTRV